MTAVPRALAIFENSMHPALQIALGILATIAAIASAVAAWKSQVAANESLNFQKKLSKHQDSLLLLRSTLDSLWQLKKILKNPHDVSDEEFINLESIHSQIKTNLKLLERAGISFNENNSEILKASSFGEIVDKINNSEIELELITKSIQRKVDEIFA